MRFFVTCDADIESGVSDVLYGLNKAFDEYFGDRFYDDSGINISVILMCRDPVWNFKQRIRFSKKENNDAKQPLNLVRHSRAMRQEDHLKPE